MALEVTTRSSKKSPNFSLGETSILLRIWGSPEYQQKFAASGKRHTKIWQEISTELFQQSMDESGQHKFAKRTGIEVKNKVNNEKKKYSKLISALKSGNFHFLIAFNTSINDNFKSLSKIGVERPKDDPIFDIMDQILGCRPVANTAGVSDSLDNKTENGNGMFAKSCRPYYICTIFINYFFIQLKSLTTKKVKVLLHPRTM